MQIVIIADLAMSKVLVFDENRIQTKSRDDVSCFCIIIGGKINLLAFLDKVINGQKWNPAREEGWWVFCNGEIELDEFFELYQRLAIPFIVRMISRTTGSGGISKSRISQRTPSLLPAFEPEPF